VSVTPPVAGLETATDSLDSLDPMWMAAMWRNPLKENPLSEKLGEK